MKETHNLLNISYKNNKTESDDNEETRECLSNQDIDEISEGYIRAEIEISIYKKKLTKISQWAKYYQELCTRNEPLLDELDYVISQADLKIQKHEYTASSNQLIKEYKKLIE